MSFWWHASPLIAGLFPFAFLLELQVGVKERNHLPQLRWRSGLIETNLFPAGLAKTTRFFPLSEDFMSSSSSNVDRNISFVISPNSLSSLLGLDGILCSRLFTELKTVEASGAFERPAPGHQVSRLCRWTWWEENRQWSEPFKLATIREVIVS